MMTALQSLVEELEQNESLEEPERLRERFDALDRLDAQHWDAHPLDGQASPQASEAIESAIHSRARALCAKLEAANSKLYEAIREEIRRGCRPDALLQHVFESRRGSGAHSLARGEGYNYLDDLVSGVLQFEKPDDSRVPLAQEMVPYQPTPARHIFDLIAVTALTEHDVLIDLGSGLGHVPLLVSICTPARSIGVELEPAFIHCARQCAQSLNLNNITILQQDARATDLSKGTVFYLYTPFTGTILRDMLLSLKRGASHRKIRVCTYGPCTPIVAQEPWLTSSTTPKANRIVVFTSRNTVS